MATQPKSMNAAEWEKHVKESREVTAARAAVEANPTDKLLELEARVAKLEGKGAPKAKKS